MAVSSSARTPMLVGAAFALGTACAPWRMPVSPVVIPQHDRVFLEQTAAGCAVLVERVAACRDRTDEALPPPAPHSTRGPSIAGIVAAAITTAMGIGVIIGLRASNQSTSTRDQGTVGVAVSIPFASGGAYFTARYIEEVLQQRGDATVVVQRADALHAQAGCAAAPLRNAAVEVTSKGVTRQGTTDEFGHLTLDIAAHDDIEVRVQGRAIEDVRVREPAQPLPR